MGSTQYPFPIEITLTINNIQNSIQHINKYKSKQLCFWIYLNVIIFPSITLENQL
ncbi:hypothetical protein pb186bvf_018002 [Paramecium bursaria]